MQCITKINFEVWASLIKLNACIYDYPLTKSNEEGGYLLNKFQYFVVTYSNNPQFKCHWYTSYW